MQPQNAPTPKSTKNTPQSYQPSPRHTYTPQTPTSTRNQPTTPSATPLLSSFNFDGDSTTPRASTTSAQKWRNSLRNTSGTGTTPPMLQHKQIHPSTPSSFVNSNAKTPVSGSGTGRISVSESKTPVSGSKSDVGYASPSWGLDSGVKGRVASLASKLVTEREGSFRRGTIQEEEELEEEKIAEEKEEKNERNWRSDKDDKGWRKDDTKNVGTYNPGAKVRKWRQNQKPAITTEHKEEEKLVESAPKTPKTSSWVKHTSNPPSSEPKSHDFRMEQSTPKASWRHPYTPSSSIAYTPRNAQSEVGTSWDNATEVSDDVVDSIVAESFEEEDVDTEDEDVLVPRKPTKLNSFLAVTSPKLAVGKQKEKVLSPDPAKCISHQAEEPDFKRDERGKKRFTKPVVDKAAEAQSEYTNINTPTNADAPSPSLSNIISSHRKSLRPSPLVGSNSNVDPSSSYAQSDVGVNGDGASMEFHAVLDRMQRQRQMKKEEEEVVTESEYGESVQQQQEEEEEEQGAHQLQYSQQQRQERVRSRESPVNVMHKNAPIPSSPHNLASVRTNFTPSSPRTSIPSSPLKDVSKSKVFAGKRVVPPPPPPPEFEEEEEKEMGSPSFLSNVKLRKTGILGQGAKPKQQEVQEEEPELQEEEKEEMEEIYHEQPPHTEPQPQTDERSIPPTPPPQKKLTYREQQELLKQQKAAEEAAIPTKPHERDVASLIRRRIAANRRNAASQSEEVKKEEEEKADIVNDDVLTSPRSEFKNMRNRLKAVSRQNSSKAVQNEGVKEQQHEELQHNEQQQYKYQQQQEQQPQQEEQQQKQRYKYQHQHEEQPQQQDHLPKQKYRYQQKHEEQPQQQEHWIKQNYRYQQQHEEQPQQVEQQQMYKYQQQQHQPHELDERHAKQAVQAREIKQPVHSAQHSRGIHVEDHHEDQHDTACNDHGYYIKRNYDQVDRMEKVEEEVDHPRNTSFSKSSPPTAQNDPISPIAIAQAAAAAASSRKLKSTPLLSLTRDTEPTIDKNDNEEQTVASSVDESSGISTEGKNKLSNLFAQRSASLSSSSQSRQLPPQELEGPTRKSQSRSKVKEVAEERKVDSSENDHEALSAALLMRMKERKSVPSPSSSKDSTHEFEKEEESIASKDDKTISSSATDAPPPLKHDPMYTKYFKMLKVGMPMGAVQHAMQRDGLDPTVMDGDHNKPAGFAGVPLKEDPQYAKYFKMLKVGMPMGAVQNAMQRDGLDPTVMDGDHNLPAGHQKGGGGSPSNGSGSKKPKDTHRRTRLHWDTLRKVRSNSVWAMVDKDPDVEQIHIDENEFASLFQAELKPSTQKLVGKGDNKKKAVVKVIDPKRANNGGIVLARLKLSYEEIAAAVHNVDETVISAEQMEGIIEYVPTPDERRKLRIYMSEPGKDSTEKFEELCECEKFMVAMMTVKYPKQKMRALLFRLQFSSGIEDLEKDASMVENACDELSQSVRLRKLLGIVLNIGNRLNTAGHSQRGKAGAFTIESLLKLNQAKAFDKKTTFLQYIVLIVLRNNELLMKFKNDLPTVMKAEKIYWDQCVSDLEEVENQLENVRKIALHQARIESGSAPSMKNSSGDDSDSMSDASISLEEEVDALRSTSVGTHTLDAIKKVSAIREKVEMTKAKFAQLLEYFGEEDNDHMQPHELFQIIVKFCKDFDAAKEEVLEKERQKRVEERRRQSREDSGSVASEESSVGKKKSTKTPPRFNPRQSRGTPSRVRVSSMQPNMGSVLNDIKNFSKKKLAQTIIAATSIANDYTSATPENGGNKHQSNQNDEHKANATLSSSVPPKEIPKHTSASKNKMDSPHDRDSTVQKQSTSQNPGNSDNDMQAETTGEKKLEQIDNYRANNTPRDYSNTPKDEEFISTDRNEEGDQRTSSNEPPMDAGRITTGAHVQHPESFLSFRKSGNNPPAVSSLSTPRESTSNFEEGAILVSGVGIQGQRGIGSTIGNAAFSDSTEGDLNVQSNPAECKATLTNNKRYTTSSEENTSKPKDDENVVLDRNEIAEQTLCQERLYSKSINSTINHLSRSSLNGNSIEKGRHDVSREQIIQSPDGNDDERERANANGEKNNLTIDRNEQTEQHFDQRRTSSSSRENGVSQHSSDIRAKPTNNNRTGISVGTKGRNSMSSRKHDRQRSLSRTMPPPPAIDTTMVENDSGKMMVRDDKKEPTGENINVKDETAVQTPRKSARMSADAMARQRARMRRYRKANTTKAGDQLDCISPSTPSRPPMPSDEDGGDVRPKEIIDEPSLSRRRNANLARFRAAQRDRRRSPGMDS